MNKFDKDNPNPNLEHITGIWSYRYEDKVYHFEEKVQMEYFKKGFQTAMYIMIFIQQCPHCKGRKWVPNIYNRPSVCGECCGYGTVKYCDCGKSMPIWQNKCYECILKLDDIIE